MKTKRDNGVQKVIRYDINKQIVQREVSVYFYYNTCTLFLNKDKNNRKG